VALTGRKSGIPIATTMRKIDQFVGREMSSDRELERKEHAKQVGKEVKEEQEGEWKVG